MSLQSVNLIFQAVSVALALGFVAIAVGFYRANTSHRKLKSDQQSIDEYLRRVDPDYTPRAGKRG
jgi:hypothetical protein